MTTAKTVAVDSKQGIINMGASQDSSGDVKMEIDSDTAAVGIISTGSSGLTGSAGSSGGGVKRERDDDDFEVVP